jgi:hypothetical protein
MDITGINSQHEAIGCQGRSYSQSLRPHTLTAIRFRKRGFYSTGFKPEPAHVGNQRVAGSGHSPTTSANGPLAFVGTVISAKSRPTAGLIETTPVPLSTPA